MGIHCRPWKSISHVVNSGGSCWYQEWCDGSQRKLVNLLQLTPISLIVTPASGDSGELCVSF